MSMTISKVGGEEFTDNSPPPISGDLVGYKVAAAILSVPVGTLYSWVHQRRIPYVRLGPRLVRFSKRDLARWLATRAVAPEDASTVLQEDDQ